MMTTLWREKGKKGKKGRFDESGEAPYSTLSPGNFLLHKGFSWQARRESNPYLWYRKPLFYPLNYRP